VLIAALHRDWGEAQGNCDELRFFTGLRPSEEIELAFLASVLLARGEDLPTVSRRLADTPMSAIGTKQGDYGYPGKVACELLAMCVD
jgi:hypothetical protein